MKLRNIILLTVTAIFFASCSTTLKQRSSVDDLYYNPSAQTNHRLAENFSNEYNSILENDSLKDVDSTIYNDTKKSNSNPYDRILVDDYNEAYQRRLDASTTPQYGMNNYYNVYFSNDYWYANAFDPGFYNVIVMGNSVWVEPHYLSSHFGYGWNYSPLSYGSRFHHRPYWSSYYAYGYGYGGYGGYTYYSPYSLWNPYSSGLGYYGYSSPYSRLGDPQVQKRKRDQFLMSDPNRTRSEDYKYAEAQNDPNYRKRLQSDENNQKSTQSDSKVSRLRVDDEGQAKRESLTNRGRAQDEASRTNRYIRTAESGDRERKASTYNKVQRGSTEKYNTANRDNTLTKYIEAADRERASVVNHNYTNRPESERSRNSESILRTTGNNSNSDDVRRRSTYSRPRSVGSSSGNSNSNTIKRSSGSSNNNSGSSVRRTRSSSSSSGNSSSSSSSSSGRKRK